MAKRNVKTSKSKFITEKKLYKVMNDAVEKILEGVQAMFDEQDKKNVTHLAS